MRFIDPNIKLHINDIDFKAYLEDSELILDTKYQELKFQPLNLKNPDIADRILQRTKFTFNVLSETRQECIQNFNKLLQLLETIKPYAVKEGSDYVPAFANNEGLVTIQFSGLPVHETIKVGLMAFSYNLNKDVGYIEVPREEIATNGKNSSFYVSRGMKLIPLAYKINIEGKVILPYEDTVRVKEASTGNNANNGSTGSGGTGQQFDMNEWINKTIGTDTTKKEKLIKTMFYNITGHRFYTSLGSDVQKQKTALLALKELSDNSYDDGTGNFYENNPLWVSVPDGQQKARVEWQKLVDQIKAL